jgi:hypothetical protein
MAGDAAEALMQLPRDPSEEPPVLPQGNYCANIKSKIQGL